MTKNYVAKAPVSNFGCSRLSRDISVVPFNFPALVFFNLACCSFVFLVLYYFHAVVVISDDSLRANLYGFSYCR